MASATAGGSPMMELASRIISEIGTFFMNTTVSQVYSIDDFPYQKGENYLYVLYSGNGMPLYAGAMVASMGKRDQNRITKEIQNFGASGYVESFRVLEVGSEELTRQLQRIMQDLFSGGLPLNASVQLSSEQEATSTAEIAEPAAPVQRRRGRPRKSETGEPAAPARRRRGRPRKNAAATESGEAPVKRGRGRPRKSETGEAAAPAKRRRGRPRKNAAAAAPAEAPATRGPGRPRKNATETTATPAGKRRRGRPKKKAAATGEAKSAETTTPAAPAKRAGRPKKGAAKRGAAKRGRKAAAPASAETTSTAE